MGVVVTAPGKTVDFVSRFFAPGAGVDEDPVTGSAHCNLIPYWAERLGKSKLKALQVSKRVGELWWPLVHACRIWQGDSAAETCNISPLPVVAQLFGAFAQLD